VTINELKDSRNKLITDAQAILLASPDSEKRASAHKMIADADVIDTDIAALVKIEGEERTRTAPNRSQVAVENAETKFEADKKALLRYSRTGDNSGFGETRDLTTSTYGQFVPQSFYPVLTEAQKSFGQIVNAVKTVNTADGSPMKYAVVNDTGRLMTVIAEATGVSETDPTSVGGSTISTDFITTGVIKISLAQLQDSAFNIEDWVKNAFGNRYFRGLSQMVTNGNSSNVASLKTSTNVGATTASPTAIAWSDIVALYASLDPAYEQNAVWSMNSTTRGDLLAITDTLGRPLYTPSVTTAGFDMILGHPVVISQYMDNADVATNVPILYGDHSAYLLRIVNPGLSLNVLREAYLPSGEIGVIGYARVGGALLQAGINPIVSLAMHA
jgi:HK97 family phage major capsid protein